LPKLTAEGMVQSGCPKIHRDSRNNSGFLTLFFFF